jgi:hypothetical protein
VTVVVDAHCRPVPFQFHHSMRPNRRTPHSLSLRTENYLTAVRVRSVVLRRHQPRIVTKRLQFGAQVMRSTGNMLALPTASLAELFAGDDLFRRGCAREPDETEVRTQRRSPDGRRYRPGVSRRSARGGRTQAGKNDEAGEKSRCRRSATMTLATRHESAGEWRTLRRSAAGRAMTP